MQGSWKIPRFLKMGTSGLLKMGGKEQILPQAVQGSQPGSNCQNLYASQAAPENWPFQQFKALGQVVPTEGHLSPVFGFISSSIFADPQQLMEREIEEVRGRNVMMQGHEMKMPRDEGGR